MPSQEPETIDRYTIDTAPATGFHYRLALFTGGGKFIDGYTLGVLTVALAVIPPDFGMTPFYAGLVGSAALFGLFIGSAFIGPLADRIGRKRLYTADLILFLAAALAQFFVQSPSQLFVMRLILGIAIGIDYAVAPTYLSEMLPKRLRGPLLGSLAAIWRIGFLASVIVGYFMRDMGPGAWKWILVTSAVPTALVMLLRLGAPESPRWLVRQGRDAEADAIVKKYINPEAGIHDLIATVGPRARTQAEHLGSDPDPVQQAVALPYPVRRLLLDRPGDSADGDLHLPAGTVRGARLGRRPRTDADSEHLLRRRRRGGHVLDQPDQPPEDAGLHLLADGDLDPRLGGAAGAERRRGHHLPVHLCLHRGDCREPAVRLSE